MAGEKQDQLNCKSKSEYVLFSYYCNAAGKPSSSSNYCQSDSVKYSVMLFDYGFIYDAEVQCLPTANHKVGAQISINVI